MGCSSSYTSLRGEIVHEGKAYSFILPTPSADRKKAESILELYLLGFQDGVYGRLMLISWFNEKSIEVYAYNAGKSDGIAALFEKDPEKAKSTFPGIDFTQLAACSDGRTVTVPTVAAMDGSEE